jgi:hypothetical protein
VRAGRRLEVIGDRICECEIEVMSGTVEIPGIGSPVLCATDT